MYNDVSIRGANKLVYGEWDSPEVVACGCSNKEKAWTPMGISVTRYKSMPWEEVDNRMTTTGGHDGGEDEED